MVERERTVDKLEALLRELAKRSAKLEELAVANLNYLKPRVKHWLKEGIEFPLEEVLTEEEERMIKFYSGLNGKGRRRSLLGEALIKEEGLNGKVRMHSLAETAAYLGRSPKSEKLMSATLRYCWIRLKRRELVGPEAVETLKLPGLIYSRLIQMGVVEIDDIPNLSPEQIRGACGNEWGLSILKVAMQKKGFDWQPEVKFPLFAAKGKGY